jgi:hypothetical protein
MRKAALCLLIVACGSAAYAQQEKNEQNSPAKHSEMVKRGEHEMGFSQEKTTHHFLLYADGGAIAVAANLSDDAKSREEIRTHLGHIAIMFAAGNFEAPMFIHNTPGHDTPGQNATPPGVATMTKLHDQIAYLYEETPNGGRVRISSKNGQAVDAIHAFLLFQIVEHQTGDSPAIAELSPER